MINFLDCAIINQDNRPFAVTEIKTISEIAEEAYGGNPELKKSS